MMTTAGTAGRRLALVGVVLGFGAGIGFGLVIHFGSVPPERDVGLLGFPVIWSMPALLALLSLRSRPLLLLPAAVIGFVLALTSLSGVALVLLVPAALYLVAYRRQPWYPSTFARPLLAMAIPVLATAAAFVVLLVDPDAVCWSYTEGADGERSYERQRCPPQAELGPFTSEAAGEASGAAPPEAPGVVAAGGGSTSDTVTAGATASTALVVAGAVAAGALASPAAVRPSDARPDAGDPGSPARGGSRPGRSRRGSRGW